jgi:hypothetical protein
VRLSEWRASAPHKDAASSKVTAVVDPILVAFGAQHDPHCWVAWGEEPASRYSILVPTDAGLVVCFVRVNVPGEGPRASTKLIRWNRVSVGELGLETQSGHRLLSFQVEGTILRGVDAEADRVAAFALRLIAAIDGRATQAIDEAPGTRRRSAATAPAPRTSAVKRASAAG